jgi:hypothetical protein
MSHETPISKRLFCPNVLFLRCFPGDSNLRCEMQCLANQNSLVISIIYSHQNERLSTNNEKYAFHVRYLVEIISDWFIF